MCICVNGVRFLLLKSQKTNSLVIRFRRTYKKNDNNDLRNVSQTIKFFSIATFLCWRRRPILSEQYEFDRKKFIAKRKTKRLLAN